jgi:hypothetical protein
MALVLAEAMFKAEQNQEEGVHFPWRFLTPFFLKQGGTRDLLGAFEKRDFVSCWWIISALTTKRPSDVLVVAPFYYRNEPVFGPSLVFPRELSVTCTFPSKYQFPSSVLRLSWFPWTLQVDVELSAIYVRQLMLILQPTMVATSDDAGILVLAKLGSKFPASSPLIACLQRSMTWPAIYPPPALSKLIPGHEGFAPAEVLLSESDGTRYIALDRQRVQQAFEQLQTKIAYIKREYSKDSEGVQVITEAIESDKVFLRTEGVGLFDLDLPMRIFLQAPAHPSVTVGARFFAVRGQVLGMVVSIRKNVLGDAAVSYSTIRNADVEQKTIEFIRLVNYTGFGATWWWLSLKEAAETERDWLLVDFNARIERHTCLSPILPQQEQENDVCVIFQNYVRDGQVKEPLQVVGGDYFYCDPIRISERKEAKGYSKVVDYCDEAKWNVESRDKLLKNSINF